MSHIEDALVPAADDVYVRALTKLIEFSLAFGIPTGDAQAVQRIYREKLGDLPADLLMRAIVRVTDGWTWGNRLPMPAEIRKLVSGELTHRRCLLAKARVAMLKARDDAPRVDAAQTPVTPERLAEVRALIKSVGKGNVQRKT